MYGNYSNEVILVLIYPIEKTIENYQADIQIQSVVIDSIDLYQDDPL